MIIFVILSPLQVQRLKTRAELSEQVEIEQVEIKDCLLRAGSCVGTFLSVISRRSPGVSSFMILVYSEGSAFVFQCVSGRAKRKL